MVQLEAVFSYVLICIMEPGRIKKFSEFPATIKRGNDIILSVFSVSAPVAIAAGQLPAGCCLPWSCLEPLCFARAGREDMFDYRQRKEKR